jgi:hypothetical protein
MIEILMLKTIEVSIKIINFAIYNNMSALGFPLVAAIRIQ